jgi:hypothetical protein
MILQIQAQKGKESKYVLAITMTDSKKNKSLYKYLWKKYWY